MDSNNTSLLLRTADRFSTALAQATEAHPPPCLSPEAEILPCDLGFDCPLNLNPLECPHRYQLKQAISLRLRSAKPD